MDSILREALLIIVISCALGCAQVEPQVAAPPHALQKQQQTDIRLMSWNVRLSSILPTGTRHESFVRIVRAIQPDIIALQEMMWPPHADSLAHLMNSYFPMGANQSWQVHAVADNVLISRFPMRLRAGDLVVSYPYPELGLPEFQYGYAAALISVPRHSSRMDFLFVNMHNKSGDGEENLRLRQIQSDTMASWLRDIRNANHASAIPHKTPIVIAGDMNVIPDSSLTFFHTLLKGDIFDEENFGPDFAADWDSTDMVDSRPSHNAKNEDFYTYRNDDMPYPPSALDRIIYTDSVIAVRQCYVLNTTTLAASDLVALGLQKSDVLFDGQEGVFDHLPLIVDFAITSN